jgi:hypothetical protein
MKMTDQLGLKAWFVWCGEEWGDWVHGETATKAKSMFWDFWGGVVEEWIDMQPIRYSRLDGIPINRKNISAGLTEYEIEEWGINYRDLICKCEICKKAVEDE